MAELFLLTEGAGPLLISVPHSGMDVPEDLRENYTEAGLSGMDADVFVDQLYSFSKAHGFTNLISNISRYVVDLNRSPRDENLYPGQFSTGLVPTVSFDQQPLYLEGKEPEMIERIGRIKTYFFPYHQALEKALQEKKEQNGRALLWDAHSIKSHVPSLFPGKLPDFNFGTFDGKSCGLPVEEAFTKVMKEFPEFSFVFNGRFKGGYTTRHYGRPSENIHAVQLELSQATYLNEEARKYEGVKAAGVKVVLARLLQAYLSLL